MVPKIHEVVYFQKIRPFIKSWSLMCTFKTQADTYKTFSYPLTYILICTNCFMTPKNVSRSVLYSTMTCQTIYFLMITAKYTNRWQSMLEITKVFVLCALQQVDNYLRFKTRYWTLTKAWKIIRFSLVMADITVSRNISVIFV